MVQVLKKLGLAALLASVALTGVVAMPASADEGDPVPVELLAPRQVGTVTAIEATVEKGTPLWEIEVTFTLEGVACPADLHYMIQGTERRVSICGANGIAPPELTVLRPVYDKGVNGVPTNDSTLRPSTPESPSFVDVDYAIRMPDSQKPVQNNYLESNGDFSPKPIKIPPRPVWVGLGDGYTSQLLQKVDLDWAGAPFDGPNASNVSWIRTSVGYLNQGYLATPKDPEIAAEKILPPPAGSSDGIDWTIEPVNYALDGTTAIGDPAEDPDQERPQLLDQLPALLEVLEDHKGSWNWIGVTAGLVDTGIPFLGTPDDEDPQTFESALEAFYAANDPNEWDAPRPHAVSTADECPSYGEAEARVTPEKLAVMRANIERIADEAQTIDEGLRIVQLLYPNFVEASQIEQIESVDEDGNTVYTPGPVFNNPCAAANHALIEKLNAGIRIEDAENARFSVDLRDESLMGSKPTGTRYVWPGDPDDQENDPRFVYYLGETYLQLTAPYGYPYPSEQGASKAGGAVLDVVFAQVADLNPTISVDVTGTAANGWYRVAPTLRWYATDPPPNANLLANELGTSTSGLPWSRLPGDSSPVMTSGAKVYAASIEGETAYTETACDPRPGGCVTFSKLIANDFTGPIGTVTFAPAANAAGWHNTEVTATWLLTADPLPSGVTRSSGIDGTTIHGPVSYDSEGADQEVVNATDETGRALNMCDRAGNCAVVKGTLNIDLTLPEVTGTASTPDWTNGDVVVTWAASDALSGLSGGVPAPTTATLEGTYDFESPEVCDRADNCTVGKVPVKIDKTPPGVIITGPEAREYQATEVRPAAVCEADPGAGSPIVDCDIQTATTAIDGGIQVTTTATATDAAGNVSEPVTLTYTVVGAPAGPPAVVGIPVRDGVDLPADGDRNNWFNRPFSIRWVITAQPGFPVDHESLPDTPVLEGESQTISSTSVCDTWGNCAVGTVTVSADYTAPEIAATPSRDANGAGWFNSAVDVSWAFVQDNLSGFDSSTQSPSVTHGGDVTGLEVVNDDGTMCDLAGNCSRASLFLSIDETDPTVSAVLTSASTPNGGWYSDVVTVSWDAADEGGSGLVAAVLEGGSTSGSGLHPFTTPSVCDAAGNCVTGGVTVQVDVEAPTVDILGVIAGGYYTQADVPAPTCQIADQVGLSGIETESCVRSATPIPGQYGAPGEIVTYTATGTDVAGNSATTSVTYTVFDFTPDSSGRMTGSAEVGNIGASFTLRCNGSPNNLRIQWPDNGFTLDWIDGIYCWDAPTYSEGQPNAPIDSLWLLGRGELADGTDAVIELVLTDRGEPGRTRDTMQVRIRALDGTLVLASEGLLSGGGNVQAHYAQGNGTNDNGNVNGPTGNTGNNGSGSAGTSGQTPPSTPAPPTCTITSASFQNGSLASNVVKVKGSNKKPLDAAFTFTATSSKGCTTLNVEIENFEGTALRYTDSEGVRTWTLSSTSNAKFTIGNGQSGRFTASGGATKAISYSVQS